MKYCYECGRITAGEPLYCSFCGRTYDVKLCPRHHVNPRSVEVCSQCGSRELSTPQPKVPVSWRIFGFLLKVALGSFLVYVSLAVVVEFVRELATEPAVQYALVAMALLLVGLWVMWSMLPDWLRKVIHHALQRKKDKHGGQ